jgi:phosphoglycolate phosphatase-like HAD superfamily hydrolase
MLIEAANDLRLNLAACFMVGDSESDVEAGLRAGVKVTILIGTNEKEPREGVWAVGNFTEAVEFILVQELKQSQKPDQSGN